jgi:hypothetical protein
VLIILIILAFLAPESRTELAHFDGADNRAWPLKKIIQIETMSNSHLQYTFSNKSTPKMFAIKQADFYDFTPHRKDFVFLASPTLMSTKNIKWFFVNGDSVTRFLTSGFFHQTIPPGPLINGLKYFCIWLRIREVIRQSRCTSGVIDTAGAASVVSMTPLVPPQRC